MKNIMFHLQENQQKRQRSFLIYFIIWNTASVYLIHGPVNAMGSLLRTLYSIIWASTLIGYCIWLIECNTEGQKPILLFNTGTL